MKKIAYFAAMCFGFVFCSCEKSNIDLGDDSQVNIETKTKMQATINRVMASNFDVYSEETSMARVFETGGAYNGNQILRRSIITNNLGSRETSEVGNWTVVSTTVSEPLRVGVREGDDPLFTITSYRVTINSTITNGEVVMNPEYILNYEDCSWSNGDTTIVFDVHWDVLDEIVKVNGNVVNDELSTSFCEYRQNANEIGTLTTPHGAAAMAVPFTVTIDPDHANTWLVGCSVPVNGGTMVVVLTPEGTPITSKFWEGDVNTAYNGAYYIPRAKAWYPAIASDHTDGMEWTVAGKSINMIAYTTADAYSNWGNGNSCSYGAHSVHLTGYSVVKDTENHRLVFSFNGTETGSVNY